MPQQSKISKIREFQRNPPFSELFIYMSIPAKNDLIPMVYCYITPDMKKQALQMPDEGLEMEDIADVLAVSARSILQWEAKYEDYGQVDPPFSLQAY